MTIERSGETRVTPFLLNPEVRRRTPVLLKPHHFTYKSLHYVRTALLYPGNAARLASELASALEAKRNADTTNDATGYFRDVVPTTPAERRQVRQGYEAYFEQLSSLPDNSVILLGLARDGICSPCPIAAHCEGTNFPQIEPPHALTDTVAGERQEIVKIKKALKMHGFREGDDFLEEKRAYTLADFEGQTLDKPVFNRRSTEFTAMLVRTGALRRIARDFD